MNIICGHCKGRHASVEMVRTCAFGAHADAQIPAFINMNNKGVNTTQVMAAFDHEVGTYTYEPSPAVPVTEPGMYQKPNGVAYRVKYSKNGFLYAEKVSNVRRNGVNVVKFEYISGAIKELTAEMRMTFEDAKNISKNFGACCVCGRTLTAKKSIEDGIGPICGGKI